MLQSMNDWKQIRLSIAEITFALFVDDQYSGGRVQERYKSFSSDVTPEFMIYITSQSTPVSQNFMAEVDFRFISGGEKVLFDIPGFSGEIDLQQGEARLSNSSERFVETVDYLLRIILSLLVFRKGGLLFHGAGIVRNEKTYIFFGHSGSGKSTVARLSPSDIILNDDLVVLLPRNGKWIVYATPFWNPTQVRPVPKFAPLTGFYRLVQDKRVFIEQLGQGQALAEIISNVPVIPDNPYLITELFTRGKDLLQHIPAFNLHFLPDDSFWRIVEFSV